MKIILVSEKEDSQYMAMVVARTLQSVNRIYTFNYSVYLVTDSANAWELRVTSGFNKIIKKACVKEEIFGKL